MKKLFYLIMLFPVITFGQIKLKGKVLDATTKQPIPYANLEIFKYKAGAQSNQSGDFVLELAKANSLDTIKISCVGYLENTITNLTSVENVIYELTPVVFQLNEVNIGKGKWLDKEIGIVKKNGRNITFFNQTIQRPGLQRAVYMKNDASEIAYIKTLYFFVGNDMYDAPFRVRVYENENGLPGKDLINKSIELAAKKKNAWNDFDISSYSLIVPENGFWVAVEWIKNDKYAAKSLTYETNNRDGTKTKSKSFTYYGPEIIQRFDTKYGLTYTKYLANKKWIKDSGSVGTKENMRQVNVDLLIKATVRVYQ